MKIALITGIRGQDAAYLVKFLLDKGYEVIGTDRRCGSPSYWRLEELGIKDQIKFEHMDVADTFNVQTIINKYKPDEIYNLAAQSFVKTSFDQPQNAIDVNTKGILNILEAVKNFSPSSKVYQASTSEMYGRVQETPQTEKTPFYPRSPYGVSKLASHWFVKNYKESYGLFACSGILFNHECITSDTPIILKRNGIIEILPAGDNIVPYPKDNKCKQSKTTSTQDRDWFIWDKNKWSKIICMTANYKNEDIYQINSRGAIFQTTKDHKIFIEENNNVVEKETQNVEIGENLALSKSLPEISNKIEVDKKFAWFLGYMVAEGSINEGLSVRSSSINRSEMEELGELWTSLTGGNFEIQEKNQLLSDSKIYVLSMKNSPMNYREYLKDLIYTAKGYKKVPYLILNSNKEIQMEFLKGYYKGDGLKQENTNIKYEFSFIGTNSSALALGMYWICYNILDQRMILYTEEKNDKIYYKINLNSPELSETGNHLKKSLSEITRIHKKPYKGWVFDFATESGTFSAGVGLGWIHNSPLRGEEFVTRKITKCVAEISLGQDKILELGNMEAMRDWGHASDFVRAMWLMLQRDTPKDYVISTGETHSVREFVELAFEAVDIGIKWNGKGINEVGKCKKTDKILVKINRDFYRPAEVDLLLGDSLKAEEELGWAREIGFSRLVYDMVNSDIERTASISDFCNCDECNGE